MTNHVKDKVIIITGAGSICINQPLGVSIGDITVRATGERYIL